MYYKNNRLRHGRGNNRPQRRRNFKTFDPSNIIANGAPASVEEKEYEAKNQFSDFEITEQLKKNIAYKGFKTPTPIQDQAIPEILKGKDLVGIANTGTGKTAAFLIPLINEVVLSKGTRVLIMAPTRELAVQIEKDLHGLIHALSIRSTVCIGGVSINRQIHDLAKKPDFVIGTPGRLLDLDNQRKINFSEFNTFVLDEVDRMLDMGFIKDINKIITKLPNQRQSLFFSATLDESIKNIMSKFITDPILISLKMANTSTNVHQEVVRISGQGKSNLLTNILDKKEVSKALVFTRTKRGADNLHKTLRKMNFQTAVLHGNRTQNQRQRSLNEFSKGKINILIATDVASRGIDVNDISHVINYDLPESREVYIHRIGRTGRANKKGVAITFVG